MTNSEGRDAHFAVSGGFLEVADNRAVVLADAAERAEEARSKHPRTDPAYAAAEAALARALNRLRVAHNHQAREE